MKVIALSVGRVREVEYDRNPVPTGIFKEPVDRRLRVSRLHIEGDEQADLSVHGGVAKAVYAYPSEHYGPWREDLPGVDLPWGAFGENLTTEGVSESVGLGDRFRIGTAEFTVTQPRLPCYKLGIRLGRPEALKRMLRTGRTGFYLAVAVEGMVGPGDAIEPIGRGEDLTIAQVVGLYAGDRDRALLRRAAESPHLPKFWRGHFRKRLAAIG